MTVASSTRRAAYTGNGVTTAFAVPFGFFEIAVYVDGTLQTISTHYTITQATPGATGTVTFLTAPAASTSVVIASTTTIKQDVDYVTGDGFPAESHERILDRLAMVGLDIDNRLDNAGIQELFAEPIPQLDVAGNPNTIIGINADGDGFDYLGKEGIDPTALNTAVTAAQTAKTQAETALDTFDDRFLGTKASDPSVDNDGNALLVGAIYWNTSSSIMKIWDGATWNNAFIPASQVGGISGLIQFPENRDYKLVINAPFAITITETTTVSTSGTCTATFKINSTALGGTVNSVSSTEQARAHSSANAAAAGDDIVLTVSANSACADLSFSIKYTRTLP